MSSIEDILNADDSDDDNGLSDIVDLEHLLHSKDDNDDLSYPHLPPLARGEYENHIEHEAIPTKCPSICVADHSALYNAGESPVEDLLAMDDDSMENERLDEHGHNKEGSPLACLHQAELREIKFLESGQKDAVSALQSKRTNQVLINYSNVRCDELTTVTNQLRRNSSYKQHGPGAATSMVVCDGFLAVGTAKGLIIVFDHQQEIRSVLGSNMASDARPISAITALDTSKLLCGHQSKGLDGFIVCGYSSGEVALWDVAKGTIVKIVTDLHSSAVSIASVLDSTSDGLSNIGGLGDEANLVGLPSGWHIGSASPDDTGSTSLPTSMRLGFTSSIASVASSSLQGASLVVVSADCEGVMYKTRFSKTMWSSSFTAESECLLDSSTGPLSAYAPLPPLLRAMQTNSAYFYKNKATAVDCKACCRYVSAHRSARLLAINVGRSQTWVVQTHPKIKILYKWDAPSEASDGQEEPHCAAFTSPATDVQLAPPTTTSRCLDWTWTARRQESGICDQNPIFVPADQIDSIISKEGVDWVPTLARCWGDVVELLCLLTAAQTTHISTPTPASPARSDNRGGKGGDSVPHTSSAHSSFTSAAFNFLSPGGASAAAISPPASTSAAASTEKSSKVPGQLQTHFSVVHRRCFAGQKILSLRWVSSTELVMLTTSDVIVTNQALEVTEKFSLQPSLSIELNLNLTAATTDGLSVPHSLHNNVCGRKLYVCVHDTLVAVQMQSCFELADRLTEKGQWLEALALVLENIRRSPSMLQLYGAEVGRYIVRYAELAVKHPGTSLGTGPGAAAVAANTTAVSAAQSKNHFHLVSGVCIEYCIACSHLELLFTHVYNIFKSVQRHYMFLEAIEPFVLSQEITSLPPALIAEFCESALRLNRLPSIERCVAYFEIAHLDMNFVTKFLYENKMFSSFLYVYSHGLNDFAGAFQIIFSFLLVEDSDTAQQASRHDEALSNLADVGYKLLLFLCYSFDGRIFPRGDAMPGAHTDLSWQLLQLVTAEQLRPTPSIFSLQSSGELLSAARALGPYPYLAKLCEVDQRATLHALFKGVSLVQDYSSIATAGTASEMRAGLPAVYGDILSYCMRVDEETPSSAQEMAFFDLFVDVIVESRCSLQPTFLGRFVGYCASNGRERAYYEVKLQTLASNQPKECRDRSSAFAALLAEHNFGIASLHACRSAGVTAEQFRRCLAFYVKEGTDRAETAGLAFQYIGEVFQLANAAHHGSGSGARHEHQSVFFAELLKVIVPLCYLDLLQTRRLVQKYLSTKVVDIIENSTQDLKMQFALLHALVPAPAESLPGDRGRQLAVSFDEKTVIKYFSLLATYDSAGVLDFLVSFEHFYPLDECMQICRNKGISEAVAFLMERTGKVLDAVMMLLDDFSVKLKHVRRDVDAQLRSEMAAQAAAAKAHLRVGVVDEDRYLILQILAKEDMERADAAKKLPAFKMLESLISCVADLCSRSNGADQAGLWLLAFDRLLMERRKSSCFSCIHAAL